MFIILFSLTIRTKSKKVCFENDDVIRREMATCVLVVVVVGVME